MLTFFVLVVGIAWHVYVDACDRARRDQADRARAHNAGSRASLSASVSSLKAFAPADSALVVDNPLWPRNATAATGPAEDMPALDRPPQRIMMPAMHNPQATDSSADSRAVGTAAAAGHGDAPRMIAALARAPSSTRALGVPRRLLDSQTADAAASMPANSGRAPRMSHAVMDASPYLSNAIRPTLTGRIPVVRRAAGAP